MVYMDLLCMWSVYVCTLVAKRPFATTSHMGGHVTGSAIEPTPTPYYAVFGNHV